MKLINDDCISAMKELIDENVQVELILTDPPYGTINGLDLKGWNNETTKWDNTLPDEFFQLCEQLLRVNGKMILFSQEPYTSELRATHRQSLQFAYPLYWFKDHFANPLASKKAPVNYVEDMSVFAKRYDTEGKNPIRQYANRLIKDIGKNKKEINEELGYYGVSHFFTSVTAIQFGLCSEKTYNKLIELYNIDKLDYYLPYEEMKQINDEFIIESRFNLWNGEKVKSNVFKYKKPYNNYHPTEKPVALLVDLIRTYSNPNDTILDFTMGSGSTGVAAMRTGRDFIGIEINPEYFSIAKQRIGKAKVQKTLGGYE